MLITLILGLSSLFCQGASVFSGGLEFRADYYQRDLGQNTIKGKGHAWAKKGNREVSADEIEVDLNLNKVFASGNVHIRDGLTEIYCARGSYSIDGQEAVLEDATILLGQIVLSGATLKKLSANQYEMEEGMYTNCNTLPHRDRNAGKCTYDIKIYGRKFSVTLEGYVHIHDGIVFAKELPLFYIPYFIAPAKSKRASGILMPTFAYRDRIGSGYGIPYFWAISPWQDLTITPTYWSRAGVHLGLDYNYAYSPTRSGSGKFFFTQWGFGDDRSQPWKRKKESPILGVFNEFALDIHNRYSLGGRAHSRQDISWVSDPFFPQDYPADFGQLADLQYLRSQTAFVFPYDSWLFTGNIKTYQSLVNTRDAGVDGGGAVQLPDLRAYRTNSTLLDYFSVEFNSRFTNFFRGQSGYDNVPAVRIASVTDPALQAIDTDPDYDANDYIRTGQRLWLEPKLVGTVPLASGFQLQPQLQSGLLLYHFNHPDSQVLSQRYLNTEIPFALYMSKTLETSIEGFEKVRHVIQPRALYSRSLYTSPTPDHPFFMKNSEPGFTNPRFDTLDRNEEFEFMRFEFNNRFLRKNGNEVQRFFLFQLANRYFLKPSLLNNNQSGIGPLEVLSELSLGSFSFQVQGTYALRPNQGLHESDWSATATYSRGGDQIALASVIRNRVVKTADDQTVRVTFYKTLPVFLDLFGSVERSMAEGKYRAYEVGFQFASKPTSCWSLRLVSGRTAADENYARLLFGLTFGGPSTMNTNPF